MSSGAVEYVVRGADGGVLRHGPECRTIERHRHTQLSHAPTKRRPLRIALPSITDVQFLNIESLDIVLNVPDLFT